MLRETFDLKAKVHCPHCHVIAAELWASDEGLRAVRSDLDRAALADDPAATYAREPGHIFSSYGPGGHPWCVDGSHRWGVTARDLRRAWQADRVLNLHAKRMS